MAATISPTSGFVWDGVYRQQANPATVLTADNGLSKDIPSNVQLGNANGAVGDPGQLLNNREIVTGVFNLKFINGADQLILTGSSLRSINGTLIVDVLPGVVQVAASNAIQFRGSDVASGNVGDFCVNGVSMGMRPGQVSRGVWTFSLTGNAKIGNEPTSNADDNLAKLNVAGSLTCERFVSAKTVAYNIATSDDNNKLFNNQGAAALVAFTLPAAVAGRTFLFVVQDADGISVTAAAGDTIRIELNVSAAGGTITSTTIGSTVRLTALNTTEWFAEFYTGLWTF
jgi:hypothetical protein